MGWFSKSDSSKKKKVDKKEDLWVLCRKCKAHVYKEEWYGNINVCPKCGYHGALSCRERQKLLIDEGTFAELDSGISPSDPLNFHDAKGSYKEQVREANEKTKMNESILTGTGKINGMDVVIGIMDFRYFGGSLGSGTGEKILSATRKAMKKQLPLIIVSASGGARMQEGILSLMQMAKTCAGVANLDKNKIPYISVLTDPTYGGVSASYAMVGDVIIAEPGARIGFAGRRVIEQTIKQKLPKDFQTAEYLLEHGFIDLIETRKNLKNRLHKILRYWRQK